MADYNAVDPGGLNPISEQAGTFSVQSSGLNVDIEPAENYIFSQPDMSEPVPISPATITEEGGLLNRVNPLLVRVVP